MSEESPIFPNVWLQQMERNDMIFMESDSTACKVFCFEFGSR